MDPLDEQGLRDEVLYLHSLWRQGPPRNHHHHQQQQQFSHSSMSHRLHPSNPIHFKKSKYKRIVNLVEEHRTNLQRLRIDSGPEWPIPKSTQNSSNSWSGWEKMSLATTTATQLPCPEELAKISASKLQQRIMKAVGDFFAARNEEDDDDSEDDEGDDPMKDDERKEYNFFLNLFTEDIDLRNYYESEHKNGDFFCLVCGGIANKRVKRFKNCLSLIQHSLSIKKTMKKGAHRAYAEAICKILAWDINQLATYSSALAKSANS